MSNELRIHFDHAYPDFALTVDVQLPPRGVTVLFGPSGSGKTTLLRLVAGLEKTTSGRVQLGDIIWQDEHQFVPTHRRELGFVFQDARLFPHLNVRQNLEYGLRRIPESARKIALDEVVDFLGIGHLLERVPDRLSGGERQRVAIARALSVSPRLLLMDEPLAALDQARKLEILPYLERLHAAWDIPVLYVSHALDEVVRLADHLLVLEAGRVIAQGSPSELVGRVAQLAGHGTDAAGVLVEAAVLRHDESYHLTEVGFYGQRLILPRQESAPGERIRLRILARDVSLTLSRQCDTSIINIFPARIVQISEASVGQSLIRLALGEAEVWALLTRKSVEQLGLHPGREVYAQIKAMSMLK